MVRPIGSYFSWARSSDYRASTPTPNDVYSKRVPRQLLWQNATTSDKQNMDGRLVDKTRTENNPGEDCKVSPFQSLDGMQECFWLEDNLQYTRRQLNICSERLDQMCDSANHIREELEDVQKLLASLGKRGGAHRDMVEADATKELDGEQTRRLLSSQPQMIESYSDQSVTVQDAPTEFASCTTDPVQVADESEGNSVGKSSQPQQALGYPDMDRARLKSVEEESFQPDKSVEKDTTTSILNEYVAGSKDERHQQTRQPKQPSPSQQTCHPLTIPGTIPNEVEHQRTPRSLRATSRRTRPSHPLASKRASLKPVIGQKKVSQMTQFWSNMGTPLNV